MGKLGAAVLTLLLVLSGCQQHRPPSAQAATTSTLPVTTTSSTSTTTSTTTPAATTWRLMAAGDVLLDDTEAAHLDAFAYVTPRLAEADLAIVNLETAVADAATGTAQDKTYVFRTPLSAAGTLARSGVDIANVANNHSLDYGPAAFLSGIDALRTAGVAVVGGGRNAEEATAAVQRTIGGVRVAVLGASRVIANQSWVASATRPGVASAYDLRALTDRVRHAKAGADVVVVVVHWGTELAACPEPTIVAAAKALRAAGATIVLGSHPHVLQPIVEQGDGLIAYSLGNFAFHHRTGPPGETALLELGFDGARLVRVTAHPHQLDRGPPRPAGAAAAARVRAALDPAHCPGL